MKRLYPVRSFAFLLCLGVLMAASPLSARAQTPPADPAVQRLRDFWHREQPRRVLLTVRPEGNDEGDPENKLPFPQNMTQWLQKNDAMARSYGAVTALAAGTVFVSATKFGPPDFFAGGEFYQGRKNVMRALLATLSEAQWRELASPQGLSLQNLSPDQKALWEMLIPNPFIVQQSVMPQPGQAPPPEKSRTLSDAERYQVRLRAKLMGLAYGKTVTDPRRVMVISRKNASERYRAGEPSLYVRPPEPPSGGDSETVMYGQSISHKEPNHPPLLPRAFEALLSSEPVAVSETGEKSTTAGELLTRIEAASGLKLYADKAFRAMPVFVVNSGNIGSGNLLRALLFATAHTVRVLPPAKEGERSLFVVVDQGEPAGRIFGRWNDWETAAEKAEQAMTDAANAQIARSSPLSVLQFDADDPLPLSASLREKVLAAARTARDAADDNLWPVVPMAFAALPAPAQAAINARAQRLTASSVDGRDVRVHTDFVEVSCQTFLTYVVPGTDAFSGEIPLSSPASLADWLPEAESPAATDLTGRTVILSADTPDEIRPLVTSARTAGAKAIWVQGAPEVISAALEVAGETPVHAVVSAFRVGANTPPSLPLDENIYGKTSREWLLPDDPQVIKAVAERVRTAATIPGIAGVVLRDAVPPGYRGPDEAKDDESLSTGEFHGRLRRSDQTVGYTMAHRRAFVQETGSDPADLGGQEEDGENDAVVLWHAWARKRLTPLWKAVREALATKPVCVEGEITSDNDGISVWRMEVFVPWDSAQEEPPFAALFRDSGQKAPSLAKKIDTRMVVVGNPDSELTSDKILKLLKREDKPEGTIWDLSNKQIPEVNRRLRDLIRPRHNTPNKGVP